MPGEEETSVARSLSGLEGLVRSAGGVAVGVVSQRHRCPKAQTCGASAASGKRLWRLADCRLRWW